MLRSERKILVAGATGRQGNAVARALLGEGWSVRALVRDPAKPAAVELQRLDAEVVKGDLDDPASLERACAGCYGAFSVQTPMSASGTLGEVRQGKALADAAARAGVEHFVYSSVGSADKNTGIPHFESKWQIEQHIRVLGIPATVLRPVFYFENFTTFYRPSLENNVYVIRMPVKPGTRLAMIAVADIGAFAAIAFGAPHEYIGLALDIGGDIVTMPEVVGKMRGRFGRHFAFEPLPIETVRQVSADLALMFEWFDRVGQSVDIADLRRRHPGLMSLVDWLDRSGWELVRD
jgi:uncharacterized protein YbjT (DUF2867 family)